MTTLAPTTTVTRSRGDCVVSRPLPLIAPKRRTHVESLGFTFITEADATRARQQSRDILQAADTREMHAHIVAAASEQVAARSTTLSYRIRQKQNRQEDARSRNLCCQVQTIVIGLMTENASFFRTQVTGFKNASSSLVNDSKMKKEKKLWWKNRTTLLDSQAEIDLNVGMGVDEWWITEGTKGCAAFTAFLVSRYSEEIKLLHKEARNLIVKRIQDMYALTIQADTMTEESQKKFALRAKQVEFIRGYQVLFENFVRGDSSDPYLINISGEARTAATDVYNKAVASD